MMFRRSLLLTLLPLLFGLSHQAPATVLYDNGPVNATINAWNIGSGFAVADSFTLSSNSTVTDVHFDVWNFTGKTISTVEWSITSAAGGGTVYGSGTASVASSFLFVNGFGFDINADSFTVPGVGLLAGTYFLELQNAVVPSGDPAFSAFWDQTFGQSIAWENTTGFLYLVPGGNPQKDCQGVTPSTIYCSEAFQITGTGGSAPEPATLALLSVGLAGLGFSRRCKPR